MKPNFVVVNENDEIIGHTSLEEIDSKKLLYRVAALWIKNSKGESLLARRALTKSHFPGIWGPAAAGTVEKGETYEENIIKEAEEELGISNISVKKGPKYRAVEKYHHFTQMFTCTLDTSAGDFQIQEEEVAEVKWFTKKELLQQIESNPEKFTESTGKYIKAFL